MDIFLSGPTGQNAQNRVMAVCMNEQEDVLLLFVVESLAMEPQNKRRHVTG